MYIDYERSFSFSEFLSREKKGKMREKLSGEKPRIARIIGIPNLLFTLNLHKHYISVRSKDLRGKDLLLACYCIH